MEAWLTAQVYVGASLPSQPEPKGEARTIAAAPPPPLPRLLRTLSRGCERRMTQPQPGLYMQMPPHLWTVHMGSASVPKGNSGTRSGVQGSSRWLSGRPRQLTVSSSLMTIPLL